MIHRFILPKPALHRLLTAILLLAAAAPGRSQSDAAVFPPTGELATHQMPASNHLYQASDNSLFALERFFASYDGGSSWRTFHIGVYDYQPIYGSSLAVAPNFQQERRLWFGYNTGLFIADNGEWSWRGPIPGITTPVRSIAVSPNFAQDRTLFIGSTNLMISTDGGDHWQNINLGFTPDVREVQLSPTFAQDGLVFFTTFDYEFFVLQMSSTRSATHTGINKFDAVYVLDFVISPDLSSDQRIFISTNSGVFRSDDLGNNWSLIPSTGAFSHLFIAPNYPIQTLLLGIEDNTNKLYRSINDGKNWSAVAVGEIVSDLVFSNTFALDQTLKALTYSGLWMSSDAGAAWSKVTPTLPDTDHALENIVLSPKFENDGELFVGPGQAGSGQLFKSSDYGFTLKALDLPEDLKPVFALSGNYPIDQTMFLAFNNHLYKSADSGGSWSALPDLPFYAKSLVVSPQFASDQTILFLSDGNGLHRSSNGGESWQLVSGLPSYISDLELSPEYPTDPTMYAVSGATIFISRNDGATWDYASSPDIIGGFNLELSDAFVHDHTLFAADEGNSDGGIFRSTDGAVTWQQVGFFKGYARTFAISPHFSIDHTLMAASSYGPLYISEDRGDTWFRLYGIPYFPGGYAAAFGAAIGYQDGRLQPFASQDREFYRFSWYPGSPLQLQSVTLWVDSEMSVIPTQQVNLSVENWVRPGFVVSEDLPWLEISPITGTIPSNISFTGDLSSVTLPLDGEFSVNVHWSTNISDTYQIPIQVLTAAQKIHLPVVLTNH